MKERDQRTVMTGAVLIFLGLGFLAVQFVEGFGESMLFFVLGGAFIAGYLYRRAYGLLIPGGILMGLGLGSIGGGRLFGFSEFESIGLGIGFVAIYVIDLVTRGRSHWWPLIPGGILIVSGLSSGGDTFERLVSIGWPLLLILIGLAMLASFFGVIGRGRRRE